MRYLLIVIILSICTCAYAGQRYNAMENRWETTGSDTILKYNAMENEWSYQKRDARPEYNCFENKWEYSK